MVWAKTQSALILAQVFSASLVVLGSTLQDQCNALTKPHFYDSDTNICHVLDGPKRFIDARETCTDLPFGYLMVEHSESDMKKIAAVFNGRNVSQFAIRIPEEAPYTTTWVFVVGPRTGTLDWNDGLDWTAQPNQLTDGLDRNENRNSMIKTWNFDLSDEIKIGQMITIKGKILPALQNYRFSINLIDAGGQYLMHFDTRFNHFGSGHIFAFRISSPWTTTGQANQTMAIDQDFLVQINTTAATYEVFVNDEFIQTFPHKLPFSNVKHISIWGYTPAQPNTYVIDSVTIDRSYGGQACTWINLQPANRSSVYPDQGWEWRKDVGPTIWNANINWTNWDRDNSEPNNLEGKENCACLIASSGKLMDIECDGLAPFICSYENKPVQKCFQLHSENKKSPAYGVLKNEEAVNSNICMKKCSRINSCTSIGYNKNTKHCQLQYCKSDHPDIEPEDAPGYEYFDKD